MLECKLSFIACMAGMGHLVCRNCGVNERECVYSVWYVRECKLSFIAAEHARYRLSCIITMAYNSKHEHGITWEWLIWLSEAINADILCVSFYYGHPFFRGHSYVWCTTVRHHNCKFRFDTAVLHVPILTPVVIHVPTPWILFIYIYIFCLNNSVTTLGVWNLIWLMWS